eukprot:Skav219925  [mRNA]  locus=scaffold2006:253221:254762:- [translate_table: standard]
MFRRHGVPSSIRKLFDQTSCAACLKEYHTFARLKAHLRYADRCRLQLKAHGFNVPPGPGIGSHTNDALTTQHAGLAPTIQAAGPRRLEPIGVADETEENVELRTLFADSLIDFESSEQLLRTFRLQAGRTPTTWTQWVVTLRKMRDQHSPEDAALSGCSAEVLHTTVDHLTDADQWPFLQVDRERGRRCTLQDNERWLIEHAEDPDWSRFAALRSVPRFGRHRVLLHAFAGRRRYGDVQHFFDLACSSRPGIHVTTISVDIILDAVHGNLAKEGIQDFWLTSIRQGWVIGLLCGPPCNTWSRARGHDIQQADGSTRTGPKIVRTLTAAWGLDTLSLKELEDVGLGNLLLHFALLAFLEIVFVGGSALLEHPLDLDPNLVSIWTLPCTAFLRKLPGVRFHEVEQGGFGSSSRKPTGLLAANLPLLEHALASWTLTTETSHLSSSIGTTQEGQFKTAPLKEYPPALCGAMADSFFHSLARPASVHSEEPSAQFQRLCTALTHQHRGRFIGADIGG